ncbi:cytidine deaminase-like protein [Plectosphaerella plurivora]|uniref:Deoxycytidylate deaminase n=1 Tax=Plectosphaerella plurivora TaxID=936078 RepID=A0A9P9AEZ5_9PEZI|nr:cytidine deaminase-like protein [Plectosphaerella plurivora]
MLIGICGGICAGKKTVAQYLVDHHGFKHIYLESPDTQETPSTSSAPPERTFSSAQALLDYVTPRWQDRWVLTEVPDESVLDLLSRRPFFLLISVDAPLTLRWRRFQTLREDHTGLSLPDLPDLEAFVTHSDARLYHPRRGLQPLISRATVRLLNTSPSLPHLYATLAKLDLPSPVRLRPSWDAYFMHLATLASLRSNCMKRRVGAVLVSGAQKRVLSTGYNGTPRGMRNCSSGGCPRCNEGGEGSGAALATCLCIHAEENALLEAGRERIRDGAVLYCDTCPCLTCSIKICQVGIQEVVYAQGYSMDVETAAVFREAGVQLRQFVPPPNGLIHLENVEKMDLY